MHVLHMEPWQQHRSIPKEGSRRSRLAAVAESGAAASLVNYMEAEAKNMQVCAWWCGSGEPPNMIPIAAFIAWNRRRNPIERELNCPLCQEGPKVHCRIIEQFCTKHIILPVTVRPAYLCY